MPKKEGNLLHRTQKFYSENSRKRIKELLKPDTWKKEEIDAYVKYRLGDSSVKKIRANQLSKRLDTSFHYVLDSLINDYKKRLRKELLNKKISNQIIITAAWLDDKRYIPILKEALNKPSYYNQELVKLALARFEIEPYYSNSLNNNTIETNINKYRALLTRLKKLLFISTQKSIYLASQGLYIEKQINVSGDKVSFYSIALAHILCHLENKPLSSLEKYYLESPIGNGEYITRYYLSMNPSPKLNKKEVKKARKWFEKNRGNYNILRDAYFINDVYMKMLSK
jgi:hypothetical protein